MKKGGDPDAQLNKEAVKRMSIIIDPKLHRAFKMATAAQGREMSEVLIEFIEEYLRQHPIAAAAPQPKKGGRA